jgi:cytochrome P450
MNLKPIWIPLVHRFFPTPGPGKLTSALSLMLHAEASNMVHVTRYADIREVWEREDDFSVRTYGVRMAETTGPFILGTTDSARYKREAQLLAQVVRREDAALIQRIAVEETEQAFLRVRGRGRGHVDVIRDVGDVVPIRLAMRYYGIQVADAERLLRLFQKVSFYIFSFWFDPTMRDIAIAAAVELKQILGEIIERRRQRGELGDGDVLGRLLSLRDPFDDGDAGIARSIAGLCSGTLNAPIGLFANTVDKLLDLDRNQRRTLHELARTPSSVDAQQHSFEDYVLEGERFGFFPGVLHRYAERTTTIAAGTSREKRIAEGTTVVVWPWLAGFDSVPFERPFTFKPGRPKSQYMSFGHGRHRCLGEHIGQTLVREMSRSLFALPGLRRAHGKAGAIQSLPIEQASFPSSFRLEFDTHV